SARKALPRAITTGRDEDFHGWRKTLQHYWRLMQLLTPCWPSELSARVEAARTLSQILGDDHDLALLRQLVSAPTMVFAGPEDTAAFLKRCRAKHKSLRRGAETRGARMFAEGSPPFSGPIEADLTPAPPPPRAPPR